MALIGKIEEAMGNTAAENVTYPPAHGTIKFKDSTLQTALGKDFDKAAEELTNALKDKGYTVLQKEVFIEMTWRVQLPTKDSRPGYVEYSIYGVLEMTIQKGKTKSRIRVPLGEPTNGKVYKEDWERRTFDNSRHKYSEYTNKD
jgi:hypothetical protein